MGAKHPFRSKFENKENILSCLWIGLHEGTGEDHRRGLGGNPNMAAYGKQALVRNTFLWFIAAIYLFAFSSFYIQIPGKYRNFTSFPCMINLNWGIEKRNLYHNFPFLHNAGLYGKNGVLPAKLALREGEI